MKLSFTPLAFGNCLRLSICFVCFCLWHKRVSSHDSGANLLAYFAYYSPFADTLGQTWPLHSLMLTLFPFHYLSLGNESRAAYISLSYLSFPGDIVQEQLQPIIWLLFLGTALPEYLSLFWSWYSDLGEIRGNLTGAQHIELFYWKGTCSVVHVA